MLLQCLEEGLLLTLREVIAPHENKKELAGRMKPVLDVCLVFPAQFAMAALPGNTAWQEVLSPAQ